jgi:glycosyltransferase involved in cell wall biosynthesis
MRAGARAVRIALRAVRFVLAHQGRAAKAWAINRRLIRAALQTGGADVYHAPDLNTLYAATVCKRRTGAKLVYDSHELATGRNRMGFSWRAWASLWERRGIPQADAVIMASPGYARVAAERYGVPEPTVVLNVPDPYTPEAGWDLRKELDLPADRRVVVYQGSIQENRGIEQVIDAMAHVDGAVLVVIGYGYHRPALEALVRERGWGDRVRFFGPVPNDELLNYTASADLGVCCIVNSSPSYYHSLPNKLFEYLMAGVPVIASDFPAMGAVVRDYEVGEVCDPADPRSIAAAVRRILDDPERRARYRANTANAVRRYNWQAEQRRLLDVYDALA